MNNNERRGGTISSSRGHIRSASVTLNDSKDKTNKLNPLQRSKDDSLINNFTTRKFKKESNTAATQHKSSSADQNKEFVRGMTKMPTWAEIRLFSKMSDEAYEKFYVKETMEGLNAHELAERLKVPRPVYFDETCTVQIPYCFFVDEILNNKEKKKEKKLMGREQKEMEKEDTRTKEQKKTIVDQRLGTYRKMKSSRYFWEEGQRDRKTEGPKKMQFNGSSENVERERKKRKRDDADSKEEVKKTGHSLWISDEGMLNIYVCASVVFINLTATLFVLFS